MKVELLVNNTYKNGQTDGMKLWKVVDKNGYHYVFAANKIDAKSRCKANLTVPYASVKEYMNSIL